MPRIKKIGIILLVLLLLLVLVVVALPLWFPWVLRPMIERADVSFSSYDRLGYGRFALTDVTYRQDGTSVDLGRVEAFVPTAWLWNLWRDEGESEYVWIEDWRVGIAPGGDEEDAADESEGRDDVSQTVFRLEEVLADVIAWLPRAKIGPGEVLVADRVVEVNGATWREGELAAELRDRETGQTVVVEGNVRGGLPFTFKAVVDPFPLDVELTVEATGDEKLAVRSEVLVAGNEVRAEAVFPREGMLPEEAHVRAENFRLPSMFLDIEGYSELQGSARLDWSEGGFLAEVRARANPLDGWEERVPPLRAEAVARGDLETFQVEELEVRSPWVVATLSDPVVMNYRGELLSDESVFELAADLEEQPFVELKGLIRGEVQISPGELRFPEVAVDLSAAGITGFGVELERIDGRAQLQWPDLTVEEISVLGAHGSEMEASAALNLETREITGGQVEGTIQPELVARWLPEGISFSRMAFSGMFEGPLEAPTHRGRLEVEGLEAPSLYPLKSTVAWEGTLADLSLFEVELVAGAGRFAVKGATDLGEDSAEVVLRDVRLERETEPLLAAVGESRVVVDWGSEGIEVSIDDLDWAGEFGRELRLSADVAWPTRGRVGLEVQELGTELLTDFLEPLPAQVGVAFADLDASWVEGPVDLALTTGIEVALGEGVVVGEAEIRAEDGRIFIDHFRAMTGGEALILAEGVLPVSLLPGREEMLVVREDGAVDFRVQTDPQADFWRQLAGLAGIQLMDPYLRFEVTGTASSPQGQLTATVPRISLEAWESQERAIPKVEDLHVEASFQTEGIRLEELSLNVEGQRLEAEATVPMGVANWRSLLEDRRLVEWDDISGRIRIPGAEIAAFSRFAPTVLSPQGILKADIGISPGGLLEGYLTVEDAATRPFMPIGSVRDGTAHIEFDGQVARIEELSGTIGGERVAVTGEVGLPLEQPLTFDLAVEGTDLPLTRRPGMVIRGDLDLNAVKREGETPLISGVVNLHDSFYLAHLKLMPSGGVATPEKRPPFFSVDQEPFADWILDVELRGPGFLNVRGPIFQGLISANFDLSGTLEEPVAIGVATIDEGRVRFPFASLTIDQGEIALRPENPFQPQLFIVASGMAFGYDLTMEITGTAETPVIEFMANPPLTSEQALLMVTTGELPRDEMRFSTQQRASRFAIYFGQNLLYQLTGDDSAGNRLTIRSGEHVSEGGRETTTIELKLTDRWSAIGEYDRFDEYNVGLKWRIYSR